MSKMKLRLGLYNELDRIWNLLADLRQETEPFLSDRGPDDTGPAAVRMLQTELSQQILDMMRDIAEVDGEN